MASLIYKSHSSLASWGGAPLRLNIAKKTLTSDKYSYSMKMKTSFSNVLVRDKFNTLSLSTLKNRMMNLCWSFLKKRRSGWHNNSWGLGVAFYVVISLAGHIWYGTIVIREWYCLMATLWVTYLWQFFAARSFTFQLQLMAFYYFQLHFKFLWLCIPLRLWL